MFFDGGIGAAGKKLADAVMGFITGTGDLVKGIFNWVFGGGLFKFLKDAAGGLS